MIRLQKQKRNKNNHFQTAEQCNFGAPRLEEDNNIAIIYHNSLIKSWTPYGRIYRLNGNQVDSPSLESRRRLSWLHGLTYIAASNCILYSPSRQWLGSLGAINDHFSSIMANPAGLISPAAGPKRPNSSPLRPATQMMRTAISLYDGKPQQKLGEGTMFGSIQAPAELPSFRWTSWPEF